MSYDTIANKLKKERNVSIQQHARSLGVGVATVSRAMKAKGIKSRANVKKPALSVKLHTKRHIVAKKAVSRLKSGKAGRLLLHSDEKMFLVDQHRNSRHDRYVAKKQEVDNLPRSVTTIEATKNPQKAVVGEDGGKAPIIFVEENEKVNSTV